MRLDEEEKGLSLQRKWCYHPLLPHFAICVVTQFNIDISLFLKNASFASISLAFSFFSAFSLTAHGVRPISST